MINYLLLSERERDEIKKLQCNKIIGSFTTLNGIQVDGGQWNEIHNKSIIKAT